MSYDTRYSLEAESVTEPRKAIEELIQQSDGFAGIALDADGSCSGQACSWYEHQEDLLALSKKYPGILFTLSGEGHEAGDIWKKYFLNGAVQESRAEVTVAPVNLKELMSRSRS